MLDDKVWDKFVCYWKARFPLISPDRESVEAFLVFQELQFKKVNWNWVFDRRGKMAVIQGPGTILGTELAKSLQQEVNLPYDLVKSETKLQRLWNNRAIAIIPYCMKCKLPLHWHIPAEADKEIFHCSNCKRRWLLEEDKGQQKEEENAKG